MKFVKIGRKSCLMRELMETSVQMQINKQETWNIINIFGFLGWIIYLCTFLFWVCVEKVEIANFLIQCSIIQSNLN